MSEDKLTARQKKFIEAYDGNGTEAARKAGYTGDDNALGVMSNKLLKIAKISSAIKERQSKELNVFIADRTARQKFWTEVMKSASEDMRNRLRASELLGKSEADFIEKVEHSGQLTLEELVSGSIDLENERKGNK